MNNLTTGFFYISAFAWLLCEVCVSAAYGHWIPLALFLAGFVLMFSIVGCLPISARAVNLVAPVFAALTGLGIVLYGLNGLLPRTFGFFGEFFRLFTAERSLDALWLTFMPFAGAVLRVLGGLAVLVLAAAGLLKERAEASQEAH